MEFPLELKEYFKKDVDFYREGDLFKNLPDLVVYSYENGILKRNGEICVWDSEKNEFCVDHIPFTMEFLMEEFKNRITF